jgi:hypothetical protein
LNCAEEIMNSILQVLVVSTVLCLAITQARHVGESALLYRRFLHNNRVPSSANRENEPPCCYPKQWQGLLFRYLSGANFETVAKLYIDQVNSRLAADFTLNYFDGKSSNGSQILLFDPSTQSAVIFNIDKQKKTCQKQKIDHVTLEELILPCMTDKAVYFGSLPIGDADDASDSLMVKSWMLNLTSDTTFERIVSAKNCVPVLESTRRISAESTDLVSSYYFQIKTSIVDPTVFNPPPYCSKHADILNQDLRSTVFDIFKRNP